MTEEFKPQEIYRTIAGPLETEEELKESNAELINERFYEFRNRFGTAYNPNKTPKSQKDKDFRKRFE